MRPLLESPLSRHRLYACISQKKVRGSQEQQVRLVKFRSVRMSKHFLLHGVSTLTHIVFELNKSNSREFQQPSTATPKATPVVPPGMTGFSVLATAALPVDFAQRTHWQRIFPRGVGGPAAAFGDGPLRENVISLSAMCKTKYEH